MEKLSTNKIAVLNLFRNDIFLSRTIRGIAIMLKKPYPKVFEAVKKLGKEGILHLKKAGNSTLCEMQLSKESISLLTFLDVQEAISKRIPNADKILGFKEFLDDIIIITGSYAKGKQTPTSDIDLAIISKENASQKMKSIENLTLTFFPAVHAITFTYKDFIDMLLSKEENFGKEVFKHHLIIRNPERYYHLIKEAIYHGFRSKNVS